MHICVKIIYSKYIKISIHNLFGVHLYVYIYVASCMIAFQTGLQTDPKSFDEFGLGSRNGFQKKVIKACL